MKRNNLFRLVMLAISIGSFALLSSCKGPEGPAGPAGAAGAPGADGTDGTPGVAGNAVGDFQLPKPARVFAPVMDGREGPVGVIGRIGGVAGMLFGKAACGSIGAGQLDFKFSAGRVGDVGGHSGVLDAKA